MRRATATFTVLALSLVAPASPKDNPKPYTTWSTYLGSPDASHYTALWQIDRSNVGRLQVAWSYDSGSDQPSHSHCLRTVQRIRGDPPMSCYSLLPRHIQKGLQGIEPTHDGDLTYFPCSATLTSGEVLDTVYFMPERPVMKLWETYLQTDGAKRLIRMENVAEVRDSPTRLPARFANELYRQGESGMGYTIFTIVFSDGTRQACVTSTGVDFIQYPPGKGPLDVAAVIPHQGPRDDSLVKAPASYWCIYAEGSH